MGRADGWKNGQMDECMDGAGKWKNGCVDEWMTAQMDEWIDRWIDG